VLRAGVARVVYGARDPNPVARGGAERLISAGVIVEGPFAEAAVRAQNATFFHRHEQQSTFVALKLAATLDGRIARAPGVRTRITGPDAQRETMRLRAGFDAIMVGIGTVLADDPLLTVRGRVVPRKPPVRIVLDTEARLPTHSLLVDQIQLAPTWVFCAPDADAARQDQLAACGVRLLHAERGVGGLELPDVLDRLWREGISSVFCEGGAQVAAGLAAAGRIDRFYLFLAPRLLGAGALSAFADFPPGSLAHLAITSVRRSGTDALLTCDRRHGATGQPLPLSERHGIVHGIG
jgi:diaminohydroxyphosphoribosylaminopyrimidine deaminase/5-amino-6-(5-phosphoribosylamino)uracil reductase